MQNHAKVLEINITMDTGRVWSCHLTPESSNRKTLERAREILVERLVPYASSSDSPADLVFSDMFAFFRALSGVKSIKPYPDMKPTESRNELLKEAECWLSLWELWGVLPLNDTPMSKQDAVVPGP